MKNDIQIRYAFDTIRREVFGHSGVTLSDESLRELFLLLRLVGGADRLARFVPKSWSDGDFELCVSALTKTIESKKQEVPPVLVAGEEEVKKGKEGKGKGIKKAFTGSSPVPA